MDEISKVEKHLFFIVLFSMALIACLYSYADYKQYGYILLSLCCSSFIYLHIKSILKIAREKQ